MKRMLAFAILFAPPATAQEIRRYSPASINLMTGNQLYEQCNSENQFFRISCRSYISGAVDALNQWRVFIDNPPFCLPPDTSITLDQLRDIAIDYIARNPATRNQPAPFLIGTAMSTAFPCPRPTPKPVQRRDTPAAPRR
ncbi:Rap1a/Tai family immunity protein [Sphingomonas floccifaciens]|uniref:Rap1a/Tai family immunity protein n=1 Tax=Sphingomonas floccifaciens TaxID=1844115 RepID=A0ABW4NHQ0_9SPHN